MVLRELKRTITQGRLPFGARRTTGPYVITAEKLDMFFAIAHIARWAYGGSHQMLHDRATVNVPTTSKSTWPPTCALRRPRNAVSLARPRPDASRHLDVHFLRGRPAAGPPVLAGETKDGVLRRWDRRRSERSTSSTYPTNPLTTRLDINDPYRRLHRNLFRTRLDLSGPLRRFDRTSSVDAPSRQ